MRPLAGGLFSWRCQVGDSAGEATVWRPLVIHLQTNDLPCSKLDCARRKPLHQHGLKCYRMRLLHHRFTSTISCQFLFIALSGAISQGVG